MPNSVILLKFICLSDSGHLAVLQLTWSDSDAIVLYVMLVT